jgi:hypothetical protein
LKVILTGKFQKIADGLKMEDISAKTNSRMNSMFAYHYENLRPEVILKTDDDSFRLHYQDMEVRYSFKNLFAVWDGLEFMNTRIPIILHFQAKDYGDEISIIDLAILLNADLHWNFSSPRDAFTEKKEKLENVGKMNESVYFTFDLNNIPMLEYLLKYSKVHQNNGCWFY